MARTKLRAGLLRHYAAIEQRSITQDSNLDQSSTWTTFLQDWMAIEPMSGRELIAAAAVQNVATHLITMRFRAGVTAQMRVNYNGRFFNITSPPRNYEERGRMMEFEAQEGLVSG